MALRFHSGIRWRRCQLACPVFLCSTWNGSRLGQVDVFTWSEVHDRCLAVTFSGFGVATGLEGPCDRCIDALRMLHFWSRCGFLLPSFFKHVYVLLFITVRFSSSVGVQTLCRPPDFTELRPFFRLLPQAKPEA